jgi:hypothetical protein
MTTAATTCRLQVIGPSVIGSRSTNMAATTEKNPQKITNPVMARINPRFRFGDIARDASGNGSSLSVPDYTPPGYGSHRKIRRRRYTPQPRVARGHRRDERWSGLPWVRGLHRIPTLKGLNPCRVRALQEHRTQGTRLRREPWALEFNAFGVRSRSPQRAAGFIPAVSHSLCDESDLQIGLRRNRICARFTRDLLIVGGTPACTRHRRDKPAGSLAISTS